MLKKFPFLIEFLWILCPKSIPPVEEAGGTLQEEGVFSWFQCFCFCLFALVACLPTSCPKHTVPRQACRTGPSQVTPHYSLPDVDNMNPRPEATLPATGSQHPNSLVHPPTSLSPVPQVVASHGPLDMDTIQPRPHTALLLSWLLMPWLPLHPHPSNFGPLLPWKQVFSTFPPTVDQLWPGQPRELFYRWVGWN